MDMKKSRKRDMGTIGKLTPSQSYTYNNIKVPAKCSKERAESYFNDEDFMPPRMVTVEPVSDCNLKCIMCPTHLTEKPKSFLELKIFKKIVDEAKEFQDFFVFQGTGEPLLNPELFDMIKYAKENGIKNISVSTNGTLLSDSKVNKLLASETSPDFLQISIDGHSKELFEKYRKGASFNKVYAGLKRLYNKRKELGLEGSIEISINTLLSNELDLDAFINLWGKYVDDITIGPMLEQAAQKNKDQEYLLNFQKTSKEGYISCPKPFEILTVLANGKITHCQHDFHNIHIKGDMNKGDTLLKTWRSPQYNNFRKKHIEFNAEKTSCNGCEHMYRIKNQDLLFEARQQIKEYFSE